MTETRCDGSVLRDTPLGPSKLTQCEERLLQHEGERTNGWSKIEIHIRPTSGHHVSKRLDLCAKCTRAAQDATIFGTIFTATVMR